MITRTRVVLIAVAALAASSQGVEGQTRSGPVALFGFDGTAGSSVGARMEAVESSGHSFVDGLDGDALSFGPENPTTFLTLPPDLARFGSEDDFSVRFWIRTEADADRRFVLLGQKDFEDNSLASQKTAGWVFYVSDGTWAWSVGSGSRRLTYERDNG